MYRQCVKRLLDIIIATMGLVVLSPVFVVLAILIKKDDGGPIFFTQDRVGLHKKPFRLYKFRSMRVTAPANCPTEELDNPDFWITKTGTWMRKTSLDELPQILNIIRGDMSIVGPRPVVLAEEELITYRERYGANDIRPGLTGWAQINGRDEVGTKRKAILDGEYVIRMSFLFDTRIFLATFIDVIQEKGIHEGRRDEE